MNKFLDMVYADKVWDILVVVALFLFAINLIVGAI